MRCDAMRWDCDWDCDCDWDQRNTPSPAHLKAFLTTIDGQTNAIMAGAPNSVQEELHGLFGQIGWDSMKHQPQVDDAGNKHAPPSVPALIQWLGKMIKYAKGKEHDRKLRQLENTDPTKEELSSLSEACDRLWSLDANRLEPNKDYFLDIQKGKSSYQHGDMATRPLFRKVNDECLQKPTFQRFYALLDNYERSIGQAERVTRQEKQENRDFIDAILETGPMQYLLKYLEAKGKITGGEAQLKTKLFKLWFELYSRGRGNPPDSSGFEHVFVGEERDGKILGMHNWLAILCEERRGNLDYKGYIKPRRRGRNTFKHGLEEEQVLTIQFELEGDLKPVGTSIIGCSPEFEMALYTLCFLCGEEENSVECGPYWLNIKCYR